MSHGRDLEPSHVRKRSGVLDVCVGQKHVRTSSPTRQPRQHQQPPIATIGLGLVALTKWILKS